MRDPAIWRWGERRTTLLALIVGMMFATYWAQLAAAGNWGADFFAIWSYGRAVADEQAGALYDMGRLHALQVGWGMPDGAQNPYGYPPTFAFLAAPFGMLGPRAAGALAMAVTIAAYLWAVGGGLPDRAVALLAPASATCLAMGQTGFLLAALLTGAARIWERRPLLAGGLLALLTYKPQFGLLIPVALVAAGQRRCVLAAALVTCALALGTTAALGPSVWGDWLRAMPDYQAWFDGATAGSHAAATVQGDVRKLGMATLLACTAQAAAALVAGWAVWRAWRRADPLRAPVLLAATCLAAPHAMLYDLPLSTAAVLLFARARLRDPGGLRVTEMGACVAALLAPENATLPGISLPVFTVATTWLVWSMAGPSRVARPRAVCDMRADGPAPA